VSFLSFPAGSGTRTKEKNELEKIDGLMRSARANERWLVKLAYFESVPPCDSALQSIFSLLIFLLVSSCILLDPATSYNMH